MCFKKKIIPNKEIYDVEKKLKSFYNGWKAFAFKDNIINVAIGMIIATSFKMLVNSLVSDIIMPIFIGIGAKSNTLDLFIILVPGRSHNTTYYTLKDAQNDGAVTLNYGNFIHNCCNLIIIASCYCTCTVLVLGNLVIPREILDFNWPAGLPSLLYTVIPRK